jgi:thiamine biosynthesis lipoprotein
MTLVDTLPVTPGVAQWSVWSTTARLVVTEPAAAGAARDLIVQELAAIERAASRFRPDSEVCAVYRAGGRPVPVSPLLAEFVATALSAAAWTGGDVDPTVGGAMVGLGYDRDFTLVAAPGTGADLVAPGHAAVVSTRDGRAPARAPVTGWRCVRLDGRVLTVPAGTLLDLGATAKALAADRCAALVAGRLGVGALVSLGGDIATAGPAPDGGWPVLVSDGPSEPADTVSISAGAALATSSTVRRSWRHGARSLHHIVDPRTGQPASPVWRTVSVVADRCVIANAASTSAVVRGAAALPMLLRHGLPARLVAADRRVVRVGAWPTGGTQ